MTHRRWCSDKSDLDHGHECATRTRETARMVTWLADTPDGPRVFAEQQALVGLDTRMLLRLITRLMHLALLQVLIRARIA